MDNFLSFISQIFACGGKHGGAVDDDAPQANSLTSLRELLILQLGQNLPFCQCDIRGACALTLNDRIKFGDYSTPHDIPSVI